MPKKREFTPKMDAPATLAGHPFFDLQLDEKQAEFRDAIWSKDKQIVFANAKAGTGKTVIAVGTAWLLVQYGLYDGIVYIVSPTQEQKQGYLKGTIEEKSEPYLVPLYQALTKLGINPNTALSNDIMNQKMGTACIDAMTHTFLRGTNFENKVVILEESQNFYCDELKKTLTRIHDTSKTIVIGHSKQVDLYNNPENSGFVRYIEHFKDDPRTAVCELDKNYRGWVSSHADELEF